MNIEKVCCFFGHRKIDEMAEIKANLVNIVESLILNVVYYDKNYLPPRRKNGKKALHDYQPESGTAIAYAYALKKGKEIINIFEA